MYIYMYIWDDTQGSFAKKPYFNKQNNSLSRYDFLQLRGLFIQRPLFSEGPFAKYTYFYRALLVKEHYLNKENTSP